MKMKYPAGSCHFLVSIIVPCVCSASVATAETITVDPVAVATALDLPPSDSTSPDGQYDILSAPGDALYVWKAEDLESSREYRTLFEFALPPELLAPGASIHRATLVAPLLTSGWAGIGEVTPGPVYLNGYAADENVTLADFAAADRVSEVPLQTSPTDFNHRFDVSLFLGSLPGTETTRVGFVGEMGKWKQHLEWDIGTTLQVEYSPASPTLPGLSVFSPAPDAQYFESTRIPLRARASDAQDGRLDQSVLWEVTQGDHTASPGSGDQNILLPLGTYQLRASVTDSDGNVATETRNFSVVRVPGSNVEPTVTITSPVEGMELLAGAYTPLRATALDPEDGDISQNIRWITPEGRPLGLGGSIDLRLEAGIKGIVAVVNDSGGRYGHQSINVTVLPDPHYCFSAGIQPYRYWINRVRLNGTVQSSESNNGYGDFTSTWMRAVKGNNEIQVNSPNGVSVYWTVWIDLNRDGVFSTDEALANNRAVGFTRTFKIPSTAVTGMTRMRIGMRYQQQSPACGVVYTGETEDYTVIIQ